MLRSNIMKLATSVGRRTVRNFSSVPPKPRSTLKIAVVSLAGTSAIAGTIYAYNKKKQFDFRNKIRSNGLLSQSDCDRYIKYYPSNLCKIPEKFRTLEMCVSAVKLNSLNLLLCPVEIVKKLPDDLKTPEIYKKIVEIDTEQISKIPDFINLDKADLYYTAMKNRPWLNNLRNVPDEYKTDKICQLAVNDNGQSIQYVPNDKKTVAMCEKATKQSPDLIKFVPDSKKTAEMCKNAVVYQTDLFKYIPDSLKSQELFNDAVHQNSNVFAVIPDTFKTNKMCHDVVISQPKLFCFVPDNQKTVDMCIYAVREQPFNSKYVPDILREAVISKFLVLGRAHKTNVKTTVHSHNYIESRGSYDYYDY